MRACRTSSQRVSIRSGAHIEPAKVGAHGEVDSAAQVSVRHQACELPRNKPVHTCEINVTLEHGAHFISFWTIVRVEYQEVCHRCEATDREEG